MNQALTQEVNELIQGYLKKGHTSVSYAAMIDGELIVNDSLGTTGGLHPEKATTDCTYNVASLSKIYTTVAVLTLVEAGKLDLDEPVITYIPAFKTINKGYEKITLRQCLSHACALPGTQWLDFSVADQSEVDYYKDALDFYANSHLKAEPGKFSVYCNDGFTIAEMCVAAVSEEKSFSEYCRIHVTDPIEAWSSRFARSYHPGYPLVAQGKAPRELVTAQGLGGLTTSMKHLALFGYQLLPGLKNQKVQLLKEETLKEMYTPHGKTFLKKDNATTTYGLGWDNVQYTHPEYDLGEGAARKGGASFQFGSNLLIVPKYNAVVCMSQTYDCDVSPRDLCLQILALCLKEEKNINISKYKEVPESMKKAWTGDYVDNGGLYHVSFHGSRMYIVREDSRGKKEVLHSSYGYTGRGFQAEDGHRIQMERAQGKQYLLTEWQGIVDPFCEKIKPAKDLSASWKKRLNKKYINVSLTWYDEIIPDMMGGFEFKTLGNEGVNPGYLTVAFANGSSGVNDAPIKPLSAKVATGFLDAPDNASRDLVSTILFTEGKCEYCKSASYIFKEEAKLAIYSGKDSVVKEVEKAAKAVSGYTLSAALKITRDCPVKSLKDLMEDYRCLLLDDNMNTITDTLMNPVGDDGEVEGMREVKSGYLLVAKKPAI